MAEGKRRSVCSMPGGKKGYTKTLRKTWEWLSGAPRTRDDFHPWFAELGWGKSGIVKQALAFLKFMDFIVVHEDGRLDAPPPGKFDTDESIIRALDHWRPARRDSRLTENQSPTPRGCGQQGRHHAPKCYGFGISTKLA